MNPIDRLAAVGVAVALFIVCMFGCYVHGRSVERELLKMKQAGDAASAQAKEDGWKQAVKEIKDVRKAQVDRVVAERDRALGELRKRPERLPEAARAAAAGATGAELSRPDAGFLVGEAARANEHRAALAECYAWIDKVTGKGVAVPVTGAKPDPH